MSDEIKKLVIEIENSSDVDPDKLTGLLEKISRTLPLEGIKSLDCEVLTSSDRALELVAQQLPDWVVSIKGRAAIADGDWTCTLRENARDDDADAIGIGRAATVSVAIVAALVMAVGRLDANRR